MQESGIKMEAKGDMDLASMDSCFLSKARQISYTISTHPLKNPKSSPVKEESQCPLTTTPCVLKSDHSPSSSLTTPNDCVLAAANDSTPRVIKQESAFSSRPHKVNCIKSEKSPSPGLTTDLENFQDLTEWCHLRRCAPKMTSSSYTATDELNTPIVELDEFLFTIPTPIESNNNDDGFSLFNINDIIIPQSDADFGMIDGHHQTDGGPVLATGTTSKYTIDDYYQYSNNTINFLRDNKQGDGCSDIFIDNHNYNTLNYVWSPAKTTTPQHLDSADTEASIFITTTTTTPDETEHVEIQPNTDHNSLKTPLRLDFTNLLMEKSTSNIPTINTPDVINTALELDKGFNLVRFINNDINTIEEPQSSSIITSPQELDDPDQSASVSISNDPTYTISDSADDLETDDDDDYEPPGKKRNITTTKSKKSRSKNRKTPSVLVTYDSELSNVSSSVEPSPVLKVRRGRPPKRPLSVSSESCAAGDTSELSRYRELRDKNNEASRRSRLNRKMKDQLLEEEAGELDDRNRRLKVQVSELERQLSTMRDNLMKLLLKK